MSNSIKVAFLGTGIMGLPMAGHLCKAGVDLRVWNRSPEKARSLVDEGAVLCEKAHEAVAGAHIVISILSDAVATEDLLISQDVLSSVEPNALLINMATLTQEETLGLSQQVIAQGVRYMDVPISGGEKGAINATLSIMAGGDEADFEAAKPVLSHMGRPTHMGAIGSGSIAKICGQLIVGNTMAVVAESLNFAQQMGIDAAALHEALTGSFADSVIFQEHGKRMIEENFVPGGPAKYIIPILKVAESMAQAKDVSMPILPNTRELFEKLEARGLGDEDISILFTQIRDGG